MKKISLLLCVVLLLSGCLGAGLTQFNNRPIKSPRVIAISGPDVPWVNDIRTALISHGFRVLRFATQQDVSEKISSQKVVSYHEASTRYVLIVSGYAPLGAMYRCIGGGYNFDNITAELVDTKRNETMFSYTNTGYSEGCQPLSGHIFEDISEAVVRSWR